MDRDLLSEQDALLDTYRRARSALISSARSIADRVTHNDILVID